ncbi:hypothetical protein OAB41_04685 [Gammaproteobacteria bacterium]|jgi:hypothetical protein|nr:hypothetical protein [Gammaproteobacteria bacterium]MDB9748023.1 hypothetical protein [Gammaproteobacteria bacterium]MDC1189587.1 hypothetical protein [Gammaproteobacteria bacterium]|tara:strand:- start:126 stop:455 length:330 start_codon:yes stop_codon:yes gene_type:complete
MKNRKLLSLIAMMLVSPLYASDKEKDSMEECKKDYDSALAVMQQRQKGDSLVEAMKNADKKLVMSAYSQPQQKTIRLRIEAAENFANDSAQKCFRQYKWLWSDKRNDTI